MDLPALLDLVRRGELVTAGVASLDGRDPHRELVVAVAAGDLEGRLRRPLDRLAILVPLVGVAGGHRSGPASDVRLDGVAPLDRTDDPGVVGSAHDVRCQPEGHDSAGCAVGHRNRTDRVARTRPAGHALTQVKVAQHVAGLGRASNGCRSALPRVGGRDRSTGAGVGSHALDDLADPEHRAHDCGAGRTNGGLSTAERRLGLVVQRHVVDKHLHAVRDSLRNQVRERVRLALSDDEVPVVRVRVDHDDATRHRVLADSGDDLVGGTVSTCRRRHLEGEVAGHRRLGSAVRHSHNGCREPYLGKVYRGTDRPLRSVDVVGDLAVSTGLDHEARGQRRVCRICSVLELLGDGVGIGVEERQSPCRRQSGSAEDMALDAADRRRRFGASGRGGCHEPRQQQCDRCKTRHKSLGEAVHFHLPLLGICCRANWKGSVI